MQLIKTGKALQALGGLLIALGAAGHSLAAGAQLSAELSTSGLTHDRIVNITVVWHFAGLCMVLLGLLVVLGALRPALRLSSLWISVSYIAFGVVAFIWSQLPFFLVFTALGLVVLTGLGMSRGENRKT